MTSLSADVSAKISTRICHDLINPLGAISNGLELLEAVGVEKGPEIGLVAESAARATARLNFLRIAFGAAGHDTELPGTKIRKVVADLYADTRLRVSLPDDLPNLTRIEAKTLLLLILGAESTAPVGGRCRVDYSDSVVLHLTGQRLNPKDDLWRVARGETPAGAVDPSDIHFAVLAETLSETRRTLSHTFDGEALTIQLR